MRLNGVPNLLQPTKKKKKDCGCKKKRKRPLNIKGGRLVER